jgi:hypothetical protein
MGTKAQSTKYLTEIRSLVKVEVVFDQTSALLNNTRQEDSLVLTSFAYFNQLVTFIVCIYLVPTS